MTRLISLLSLVSAFAAYMPLPTIAQNYPTKPVRIIAGTAAGSTQELAIRAIGEKFQKATGQPLVLENRPSAGGILAADLVSKAAPDGYTILLANVGMLSVNPYTFKKLPYDAESFVPITQIQNDQYVFVVHPSVPGRNVAEFVAYAKANPGKISYASSQLGSPGHLSGVMLNRSAGIDMLHIGYKSVPQAVGDTLSGHISALFATVEATQDHVRTGKLKAFAVTSAKRLWRLPDVPTFTEAGLRDMVISIWTGVVAPPGTPAAISERLSAQLRAQLTSPDVVEIMRRANKELVASTPAEFDEFMRVDRPRWKAAVEASGYKAD